MTSRHSSSSILTWFGFLGRSSSFCSVCNSKRIAASEKTERASDAIGLNSSSRDARSTSSGPLDFPIPSSRSLIGVADGEGGPALAQAKHRAPGRGLPGGWWILPAIVLGAAMWTGVALAIGDVAGWL